MENILKKMEETFDAGAAQSVEIIFQVDLDDGDSFAIVVKDGAYEVEKGKNDDADVVLGLEMATLESILSGELDGMEAFMTGALRAEGNVVQATLLTQIFSIE